MAYSGDTLQKATKFIHFLEEVRVIFVSQQSPFYWLSVSVLPAIALILGYAWLPAVELNNTMMVLALVSAALVFGGINMALLYGVSSEKSPSVNIGSANVDVATEALITERERAEQLVVSQHAEIAKLTQSYEQFLSVLHHELRTPVHEMKGVLEVTAETILDLNHSLESQSSSDGAKLGSAESLLAAAHRSSDQLQMKLEDLLLLAEIKVGKPRLQSQQLNITALCELVIFEAQKYQSGKYSMAEIVLQVDAPEVIKADKPLLTVVLRHLLDNALRFGDGRVNLRVSMDGRNSSLCVEVQNQGRQLSASQIQTALTAFEQIEKGDNRPFQGLGIGLPIAQGLVEAMQGVFAFDPIDGAGMSARFTIPNVMVLPLTSKLPASSFEDVAAAIYSKDLSPA